MFPYVHNTRCINSTVSNSIFYKEYTRDDTNSATILREASEIVTSSTYFKQIGGCRINQFMANWAFEVTWLEVVDANRDCSEVRSIEHNQSSCNDALDQYRLVVHCR